VRFEILTAMFEDSVFLDAIACRLMSVSRRFKGTTVLQNTHRTIQRHVLDDLKPQKRCENLKCEGHYLSNACCGQQQVAQFSLHRPNKCALKELKGTINHKPVCFGHEMGLNCSVTKALTDAVLG
jgi:hypothetical protein